MERLDRLDRLDRHIHSILYKEIYGLCMDKLPRLDYFKGSSIGNRGVKWK